MDTHRQTKPPWKPWPPPQPDWPPHVVAIYHQGCQRIDALRKQMEPDGICPIPFICYLCMEERTDFSFIQGDGIPICVKCCPVPESQREESNVPT